MSGLSDVLSIEYPTVEDFTENGMPINDFIKSSALFCYNFKQLIFFLIHIDSWSSKRYNKNVVTLIIRSFCI